MNNLQCSIVNNERHWSVCLVNTDIQPLDVQCKKRRQDSSLNTNLVCVYLISLPPRPPACICIEEVAVQRTYCRFRKFNSSWNHLTFSSSISLVPDLGGWERGSSSTEPWGTPQMTETVFPLHIHYPNSAAWLLNPRLNFLSLLVSTLCGTDFCQWNGVV